MATFINTCFTTHQTMVLLITFSLLQLFKLFNFNQGPLHLQLALQWWITSEGSQVASVACFVVCQSIFIIIILIFIIIIIYIIFIIFIFISFYNYFISFFLESDECKWSNISRSKLPNQTLKKHLPSAAFQTITRYIIIKFSSKLFSNVFIKTESFFLARCFF